MAEHFLNASQVGAGVEHVRGEAVAKHMGADVTRDTGGGYVLVELAADGSVGDALAGAVDEQRPGGRLTGRGGALMEIDLNRRQGAPAQRRQAFFLSFAPNPQRPAELIEILDIQFDQFADSQAGGVDGFENGPISRAQQRARIRRRQQGADLLDVEALGQTFVLPRRTNDADRRAGQMSLADQVLVEAPQGGELSGGGGLGIAAVAHHGQVGADVHRLDRQQARVARVDVHLVGGGQIAVGQLAGQGVGAFGGPEELAELGQVGSVAAERVDREVPLGLEVLEKVRDEWQLLHDRPWSGRPSVSTSACVLSGGLGPGPGA